MRDEQTLKIELLSQWKLEAEFRNNNIKTWLREPSLGVRFPLRSTMVDVIQLASLQIRIITHILIFDSANV